MTDYNLKLIPPMFECGHCLFTSALQGEWSIEDGRLVFRAAADPQPRRGPDLDSCIESDPVVKFAGITDEWRGTEFTDAQFAELRTAAHAAH